MSDRKVLLKGSKPRLLTKVTFNKKTTASGFVSFRSKCGMEMCAAGILKCYQVKTDRFVAEVYDREVPFSLRTDLHLCDCGECCRADAEITPGTTRSSAYFQLSKQATKTIYKKLPIGGKLRWVYIRIIDVGKPVKWEEVLK